VLNKCDLHEAPQIERLGACLRERFSRAELMTVSARTGAGMDAWFERIGSSEQEGRPVMEVDYQRYGEGEALLGWLNASVDVGSGRDFDGNALLRALAANLHQRLQIAGAEIAHMKMTLDPSGSWGELAVINLVRNDYVAELSQELEQPLSRGQLIVNLRAEAPPETLRAALDEALLTLGSQLPELELALEHVESFRPGQPVPTHRDGA
jgi:G3E family GTPase